jgi:hypothetical protein
MAAWPGIANPSFPLQEGDYLPQVRTEFEANYVQSRAKATRARGFWTLYWKAMTDADFATLSTFFKTNLGSTFTWTHPVTDTEYTVRFVDDRLEAQKRYPGRYEVTVKLEEQ